MKRLKGIWLTAAQSQTSRLMLAGIVVLIVFGIIALLPSSPPEYPVVTETLAYPSEETVRHVSAAADQPMQIEIRSVGTKGFVQQVGVDQHQDVAAPDNVNIAGWFVESVHPGDKGLSIIDGHVRGRTRPGIFEKLSEVSVGDVISIRFGNGSVKEFSVFDKLSVAEEEAHNHLFSQRPDVFSQLNLITCTGAYNKTTRSYPERIIVSASLTE